jgi:glycosyltransferase involved in cell wall biosynthesis
MSRHRPRIVQVITRLIVGGAQLSVVTLCEELSDEFDLRIVCGPQTGPEGSLHDRAAAAAPVSVLESLRRELSPRWDPVSVYALRRTLRRLDGEIVHTHSSKAGIVGRFAAAALPARVVHTVHGWGHTPADSQLRRAGFIALERSAAKRCDALVTVSADNRDEGLEQGIGRPEIYRVIPELVELDPIDSDFTRARALARRELGIAEGVELIGWVGRFVEQKDPQTLAGVLASLLRARPATHAVLIGDGPSRGAVQARLDAAGVGQRVKLMGVVHGARRLMPAFDVVIHPSRWEGQPRVVQEALAERVPVVSARASGVEELIVEGSTGFVVAPQAVEQMIAATARVLDTPTLRAPLSERVLAEMKASHGRAVAVARHRELYRELLAAGG